MTPAAPHFVLVNVGTPAEPTPESVEAFLTEFLSDPAVVDYPAWFWRPVLRTMVLRRRPARVAHMYESIWTADGSPLRAATERVARALREHGAGRWEVSTAYRYGSPSIDAVMHRLAREEHGPVIVVPLFPQRTGATTGTALQRARVAAGRHNIVHRLEERHVEPDAAGYVEAMLARWREALAGAAREPEHLVVSFHGIPTRYARRERWRYVRDCEATSRAFLDASGWPAARATLAYQSKFGPEPWLTPATSDVLAALPGRGVRHVAVLTPGFVTDGLETIEEIGIRGEESFREAGGEGFLRVVAVEEHPAFVRAIAALADEFLAPPSRHVAHQRRAAAVAARWRSPDAGPATPY